MEKMLIRLLLVVLMTVLLTSAVHSELLVYEPFDYPVGSLDGCVNDPFRPNQEDTSAGFGLEEWKKWGGDEPAQVAEGSLVHPTYDFETSYNHAVVMNGNTGNMFQKYFSDDGRNYWYSFLYQAVNLDEGAYGEVISIFTDEADNDIPSVKIELNAGYPSLWSRYLDEWVEADVPDPAAVMWILIKVETSGSPDTTEMVYLWVDPMPGMEPHPDDADIALEYNIPSGFTSNFFWWASYDENTPNFRFDEVKIGTEFTDVSDAPPCYLASVLNPENNEINVDSTNLVLSWEVPTCLEGDLTYDIYLNDDPNVTKDPIVAQNQIETSYNATNDVTYDTTYYWRVDVHEPNLGGIGDTIYEGLPWSFITGPPSPTIKTQPQDATVPAGTEAAFTVVVLNNPTYTWYYSDTRDGEGDPITGATSPTLTISDVQKANEGYYYCVAENAYGQAESFHARLLTERLMAHWMFEGNLEDEIDPANNGISPDPVIYGDGVDEGQAVVIADPNQFVMIENAMGRLKSITISAWVKAETFENLHVILTATEGKTDGIIYLRGEGDELWCQIYGSTQLGGTALTADQWNHCVLKYDTNSEVAALYLNGELAVSTGIDPSVAPILPALSIGALDSVEGSYIDGLLDDMRIYNYPLSDLDIALLYTDLVDGGTACIGNPPYDLNEDCVVNILDFEILASNWAECNMVPDCLFSLP